MILVPNKMNLRNYSPLSWIAALALTGILYPANSYAQVVINSPTTSSAVNPEFNTIQLLEGVTSRLDPNPTQAYFEQAWTSAASAGNPFATQYIIDFIGDGVSDYSSTSTYGNYILSELDTLGALNSNFGSYVDVHRFNPPTGQASAVTNQWAVGGFATNFVRSAGGALALQVGGAFASQAYGTGTVTEQRGISVSVSTNLAGVSVDMKSINIETPDKGGGSATNVYGIFIKDQTYAGSTINKAIFYDGPSTADFSVGVDGKVQAAGYKSSDGTAGVTVSACTGFKNGLCVSGT